MWGQEEAKSQETSVRGIAHDLNNILTAASLYVALARTDCGDAARCRMGEVESALCRARELARRLLLQSVETAQALAITSMEVLVRDALKLALAGAPVEVNVNSSEDLWDVRVCRSEVSRVIENLLINSAQAMPAGGQILVTLDNIEVDADYRLSLAPGKYVRMTIYDTGAGIPHHQMERIFEPFFTTRETGTGLGLTIARSIVANHRGSLFVESESGFGTSVSVYLPAEETGLQHGAG